MLTIIVKFVASELAPQLENGEYTVADGATVREAIAVCESQCGAAVPEENFELMYPLFNGKPVRLSDTLNADGKLYICRIAMGG